MCPAVWSWQKQMVPALCWSPWSESLGILFPLPQEHSDSYVEPHQCPCYSMVPISLHSRKVRTISCQKKKKLLMFSIMHTNQYEGVGWMDCVVSPITLVEIGSWSSWNLSHWGKASKNLTHYFYVGPISFRRMGAPTNLSLPVRNSEGDCLGSWKCHSLPLCCHGKPRKRGKSDDKASCEDTGLWLMTDSKLWSSQAAEVLELSCWPSARTAGPSMFPHVPSTCSQRRFPRRNPLGFMKAPCSRFKRNKAD